MINRIWEVWLYYNDKFDSPPPPHEVKVKVDPTTGTVLDVIWEEE